MKAVDESARPEVVVTLLPPDTVTTGLTKIEYATDEVAPAESVTTIVFEYVPAFTPLATVMTPELSLIAIPESEVEKLNFKVPVPPEGVIDGPVNEYPLVVTMLLGAVKVIPVATLTVTTSTL